MTAEGRTACACGLSIEMLHQRRKEQADLPELPPPSPEPTKLDETT